MGVKAMSGVNGENYIKVKYAPIDGAHFFTAHDTLSQGLCVAHFDLKTAFNEATIQLKMLLKQNHGWDCDVEPAISFEEFEQELSRQMTSNPHIRTRVESEVDWRKAKAA
jgi:hypothetical protein